jgi:hypothetical protein
MEKRSRRRIRDLVTQAASQGLSENEIGCARISMMAKSLNALFTGRIQKRKTNPLHHSHLACNTRPVHTNGSSADIAVSICDVRYTPESGHPPKPNGGRMIVARLGSPQLRENQGNPLSSACRCSLSGFELTRNAGSAPFGRHAPG